MRIFITGVAGFLGSHLADRMIALGHSVSGNDTLIGGYIDNVPANVEFYNIDCCDLTAMSAVMKDIDIVYHTAATAHEGLSMFSPTFITQNIFQASVSTITAAVQNKIGRFIFCSSMARYGNQSFPYLETMQPMPIDPYAIAKVGAEEILKCISNLNNMEWIIAVPHNIIGPRQNYEDPYRNVMSIMINRVLQGKPPIIYGDGLQKRCFSYIDDCIFCLEKLAFDRTIKNDIFNIGPDEEFITVKYLAELIIQELQSSVSPIYFPDRPNEIRFATCDSTKAREQLGYKTTVSLNEGLHHSINYIKQRGARPFNYNYPLEIINELTPTTWLDRLM
jgi:UDP-glucose 4-epimerase